VHPSTSRRLSFVFSFLSAVSGPWFFFSRRLERRCYFPVGRHPVNPGFILFEPARIRIFFFFLYIGSLYGANRCSLMAFLSSGERVLFSDLAASGVDPGRDFSSNLVSPVGRKLPSSSRNKCFPLKFSLLFCLCQRLRPSCPQAPRFLSSTLVDQIPVLDFDVNL